MEKGKKLTISELLDIFEKIKLTGYKVIHIVESPDPSYQEIWITEEYTAYNPSNYIDEYEIKGRNINAMIDQQHLFKDVDSILAKIEGLPVQTVIYSHNYFIRKVSV